MPRSVVVSRMGQMATSERLRFLGGIVFVADAVLALLSTTGVSVVWIVVPITFLALGAFAVADALDGEHRNAVAMGAVVLGFAVAIIGNTQDWQAFRWAGIAAALVGGAYLFVRSVVFDTAEPTAGP